MTISPITLDKRPIKERRIIVYDMEWYPGTLELRLVGLFDGKRYQAFKTQAEFLDKILTPEYAGAWIYAHAGGLADFQFLLEDLMDRRYEVKAAFSGSSAIIVQVERGGHTWTFCDSFWLLRSSLKKIGEAVGIKKLRDYTCPGARWEKDAQGRKYLVGCNHPPGEDPSDPICIFYAPWAELRTYNEQDNLILWTAIIQLMDGLLEMGGELCMTQASCAMRLYRRKYLDRTIRTSAMVNERARHAYISSRVERFAPRCDDADYFDINSSFPYSMTFMAPGSLLRGLSRIPDTESELFMADAEIHVPEMYLPPLPYRHPVEKRAFFPTGTWRSWFAGVDLRLLEEMGGKILKVHRVMEFEAQDTLAAYVNDIYGRRLKSKTDFEKMLYKLLLNSLYGKFGESREKTAAYFYPKNTAGMTMLMPGIYLKTEEMDVEHEHVPVAMHITAHARRTLYRHDYAVVKAGRKLIYNDTDSVVTTMGPEEFPAGTLGKKLGQLKHEYHLKKGIFVAAKVYAADVIDIEKRDEKLQEIVTTWEAEGRSFTREDALALANEKAQKQIIKAKGFSRMTMEKFHDIVEGREVSINRMTRIRELLRNGVLKPEEKPRTKKLTFKSRPKRCDVPENDTRPWSVHELLNTKWTRPGDEG